MRVLQLTLLYRIYVEQYIKLYQQCILVFESLFQIYPKKCLFKHFHICTIKILLLFSFISRGLAWLGINLLTMYEATSTELADLS